MNEDCVVSPQPTLVSIDSLLAEVDRRLRQVEYNLHDGVYGEVPREGDTDKCDMSTPSINSCNQRVNQILDLIVKI